MNHSLSIDMVDSLRKDSYEEGVQFGIDSILEAAEFDSIEELLAFVGKHRKAKPKPTAQAVAQSEGQA